MEPFLRYTAALVKRLGLLLTATVAVAALVAYVQGVPTDAISNASSAALLAVATVYGVGSMAETLLAQRYSDVGDEPGGLAGPTARPAAVPPGGLPPRPVALSRTASVTPAGAFEEDTMTDAVGVRSGGRHGDGRLMRGTYP